MYLIDTDVLSELRKGRKAHPGVIRFFQELAVEDIPTFVSVMTIGELRRGVELIRHRGDLLQAALLEKWLENITGRYAENILGIDEVIAQVWGRMRVPHYESALDKQIAATALVHNLVLVTRNSRHFHGMGIELFDPFTQSAP